METAKPIAARLGLRVRVERGLLECDFGAWTGAKLGALRKRREWRTVQAFPSSFRFPDGESFVEMQARMLSTLDRLAERHRGETFVAVSHADPIKAAVAATAGRPARPLPEAGGVPVLGHRPRARRNRLLRAVRQRHRIAVRVGGVMSPALDLGDLDRFTVGTEGEVGQRVFLLQCRSGLTVVTLKAEKQQVSVLAEYLGRLLADLDRPEDLPVDLELEEPADPHWVIGTLGVSYDDALDRIVLVAEELVAEDEEGDMARFTITRAQAAAFAIRATTLVEAGRPPCPLCGGPLDPSGHECPRTNGHRPPAT